jgi:prolyl-tRNA editing enzyme YbaK/EbsC (Cys-tRNA(Pro) deacylase)
MEGVLEKAAVQRAQRAMIDAGMRGQVTVLSESARTAAQAATALGIEVGQIASSLVFKLPDDRPLLVITSGRHRVDTDHVAQLLNVTSLGRADADYVKSVSGYSVGGVAPIGWSTTPAITLVDEALGDYEIVWAAAGHPHAVFPTTFAELLRASSGTQATVGD